MLTGKRVLVTGGTGSLGKTIVRRLLAGEMGTPQSITVFSRDESKQHEMRLYYKHLVAATDDIVYNNFNQLLEFAIGDVRDYHRLASQMRRAQVIFNAAALKQVPTCEYFPYEAVKTNIEGPENIVRAILETQNAVETVVGISTDKACKPVNVMGMTKAIQERLLVSANISCPATRFVCVRYGNVLASRGSVIPLFHEQIRTGGPVTLTMETMTRFLLTLDDAVDTVFAAVRKARRGETYLPRCRSALIIDIARALIGDRDIPIVVNGIRPGEKVHEVLVSEEETSRTIVRGPYLVIQPILPELREQDDGEPASVSEYSSADSPLPYDAVVEFLARHGLLAGARVETELLR